MPTRSSMSHQKESYCEQIIIDHLGLRLNNAPADSWRKAVISWTWRIKVLMHLETELMGTVRERAEDEAINVFARNLHDLLMAAPAGLRATDGSHPGCVPGLKSRSWMAPANWWRPTPFTRTPDRPQKQR
ncbi:hypothetical protein ACLK2C_18155 [Escherichia coli]